VTPGVSLDRKSDAEGLDEVGDERGVPGPRRRGHSQQTSALPASASLASAALGLPEYFPESGLDCLTCAIFARQRSQEECGYGGSRMNLDRKSDAEGLDEVGDERGVPGPRRRRHQLACRRGTVISIYIYIYIYIIYICIYI